MGQTERQTDASQHCLMPPTVGGRHNHVLHSSSQSDKMAAATLHIVTILVPVIEPERRMPVHGELATTGVWQ